MSVSKYALVFQADRGPDKSGNIYVDDIQVSAGPCSGTIPPIPGGGGCKYYSHPIGEGANNTVEYDRRAVYEEYCTTVSVSAEWRKCADTRIIIIHVQQSLMHVFQ